MTVEESHAASVRDDEPMTPRGKWPPFPWNPADLDNPMVGRDEALAELGRAFDEVLTNWLVRIHLLVSDYGLGKSRLLSAFIQNAREREPGTFVIEAHCPNAGPGGGPYRLWDAVVRAAFGVPGDADASLAAAQVKGAVERWLTPDEAELVAHLVGPATTIALGGDEDEAQMARSVGALGHLLEAVAFEKPLLIMVDDANRASARDFALASALGTALKGRPIMLLLAGSENLATHLPGWDRYPVTRLRPLTRDESERMFRLFLTGLGTAPSRELVERLVTIGAGNSYAVKSLVRWLHEAKGIVEVKTSQGSRWILEETIVQRLAVPDTLEGVIHARIAALAPNERELLAQAALVGREFWLGALVAIARAGDTDGDVRDGAPSPMDFGEDALPIRVRQVLKKLVAQRFIETRASPLSGEECFGFRSSVHWEAALEALPQTTRQKWHRVVLSWLELQAAGLDVDGRGLYLRELAHHAEGAMNPALAASYHLRAARIALAEGHSRAALSSLEEVLRLAQPEQLATRLRALYDLGEVHIAAGATDLAIDNYRVALTHAWRMGDKRTGAMTLSRLAEVEMARGNFSEARRQLTTALRLHETLQDPQGVAAACIALGKLHWQLGEFDQALRCYRKSEHLYQKLDHPQGMGEVLHVQGAVHFDRGDVGLAERFYLEALNLRRKTHDQRGLVRTLNNLGAVWMSQRLEKSVEVWREALQIAQELGDLGFQATLADNLGEALTLLGRHQEARETIRRSIELAELTDRRATLIDALRNLALIESAEERWEAADDALKSAVEEASRLGVARLRALVSRTRGDVACARMEATGVVGDGDGAIALAERAYEDAAQDFEAGGYDLEAATTHDKLAYVLELSGKKKEASERRVRAHRLRSARQRPSAPPPVPA